MEEAEGLERLRSKVSITKMSDDDLHKLIGEVRDSRKRPKKQEKPPTTIKKGKKSSGKHSVDLEVIMRQMSDEEKAAVISRLEEMQK